jgi:nucleotide-binding universal stress UspA family protein
VVPLKEAPVADIERILVATDLTAKSEPAIRYGVDLARQLDASVIVHHVMNTQELPAERLGHTGEEHMGDAKHVSEARLIDHVTETLGGAIPSNVETAVTFGDPALEISDLATKRDCQLIVVTVANRSRVGKFLMGSHARRVMVTASVPVVAVGPAWAA